MRLTILLRAAAPLIAAAVLATSCADAPVAGGDATAPQATEVTAAPVRDQHAADVAYAQMMVPHVVQGVELTDMVPGRTGNPSFAQLVHSMNYVDVEEQGQLAGRLHVWGAPVPGENGVPLLTMPGMADEATLDRLRALSGPTFDRAWLDVMIAHHQGGVDMSRDYMARGTGQALATVAQSQLQVGTRQIAQMRALQNPS